MQTIPSFFLSLAFFLAFTNFSCKEIAHPTSNSQLIVLKTPTIPLVQQLEEGDTLFINYGFSDCHNSTNTAITVIKNKKSFFWTIQKDDHYTLKKEFKKSKMEEKHLLAFEAFEKEAIEYSVSPPEEEINSYVSRLGAITSTVGSDTLFFSNKSLGLLLIELEKK